MKTAQPPQQSPPPTTRDVRRSAIGILVRVERDGAHAAKLLDDKGDRFDPRDRDLLRALVKKTLRAALRLDHVLARHMTRQMGALDPPVRAALRLGAAQLLLFDRIPVHAAVGETVEAVKAIAPRAAPLVNAILRSLATKEKAPGAVHVPRDTPLATRLGLLYGHPAWLVERWLRDLGEEATRGALESNDDDTPIDLLLDPAVGTPEEITAALAADGVVVRRHPLAKLAATVALGDAARHPLVQTSRLPVIDSAAQAMAEALPPSAIALDLCAAPGGKTRTLLALGRAGRVIALEKQPARASRLARSLARGERSKSVLVVVADAGAPPLRKTAFEAILLDAPCSGTGTLRKNPEIRMRLKEADLEGFAAVQRRLLTAALSLLSPGGTLVYVTCSLEPEENEGVVDAVLAELGDEGGVERVDAGVTTLTPYTRASGLVRVPPGETNDGFSLITLRKRRQPASAKG